jgi:hypothetical protein
VRFLHDITRRPATDLPAMLSAPMPVIVPVPPQPGLRPMVGPLLFPRPVPPLHMALQLRIGEIDRAQIVRAIAFGLVAKVGAGGV